MAQSTPAFGAAVTAAGPSDRATIVADLHAAFMDDPVLCWVFPDRSTRERYGEHFFAMHARRLLPHGLVWKAPGAAAIWAAPEHVHESALDILRLVVASAPGAWRRGGPILRGLRLVQSKHPKPPHMYLPAIGVRPESQGHGLGTALLKPGLEHADRLGLPAYLESSNPRNVSLYRRHAFETTEEVDLPDGPVMTLMWRPRQP